MITEDYPRRQRTTVTEDYVSFEIAKLLKEKGFNELCDKKYYGDDGSGPSYIRERWEDGGGVSLMSNSDLDDGSKYADISAPTLQMAMKWLREIHSMPINVLYDPVYYHHYKFQVCLGTKEKSNARRYDTYEQVCEAAIKYCLEHLIL